MNPSHLSLILTVLSTVCAGIGAYVSLKIRAELAERESKLIEKLDGRYVSKELCEERVKRHVRIARGGEAEDVA